MKQLSFAPDGEIDDDKNIYLREMYIVGKDSTQWSLIIEMEKGKILLIFFLCFFEVNY